MSLRFQIIPWLIIFTPFLILACLYGSLPEEILISRSLFGNEVVVAPKSVLSVFRVPSIEVACGLVIETMRRRFASTDSKVYRDYYLFWTILLFTVALKSLAQTVETVSPDLATLAFYTTISIVIAGLIAAAIIGRRLVSNFRQFDRKFSRIEILALASLLFAYLGLAFLPAYYLAK